MYQTELSDCFIDLVFKVKEYLKNSNCCGVVNFFSSLRFSFAEKLIYFAWSSEFLGWVKNIEFIYTNSFHGTCFFVIYRKICCFQLTGNGTWIHSLLYLINLFSRYIDDSVKIDADNNIFWFLDFLSFKLRLKQSVYSLKDYPINAL